MTSNEPTLEGTPRAVFGAMLRFYRHRADLSQDALGAKAYVSGKTISAYEKGWRVPTRPATADIDAVEELRTGGALTELWDKLKDGMNYQALPAWFQDWASKEAGAAALRWFEPLVVPGLLQTEDYARALFRTRLKTTDEEVDELVNARMKRQEILVREDPPMLWVIVDEAVLRRPVGGRHVMCDQVERMADAARRPSVVIEVIPSSVGAHVGLLGAFIIADFGDTPSVGYQEMPVGGQPLEDAEKVASLDLLWNTLRTETLPRAASLALLEEAAKSWSSAT